MDMNHQAETETIFSLARKLASVRRFSRDFSINEESVLEHIGFCALYALQVAHRMKAQGLKVDMAILLQKAILHDVEEADTGDINRKAKYHSAETRSALAEFENQIAQGIFSRVFSWDLLPLWKEAKEGTEGAIVQLADYAAVAFHVSNEVFLLGNRSFIRVQEEARKFISAAIEKERDPLFADELQRIKSTLEGRGL